MLKMNGSSEELDSFGNRCKPSRGSGCDDILVDGGAGGAFSRICKHFSISDLWLARLVS